MLANGFPADFQGNVSLGGDVSLVLAEKLPFPQWLGKVGGFLPLSFFLEQLKEMVPFPALHSGFCRGFLTGLDTACALLPLHTRSLQFTCLHSCWYLSLTRSLSIYQEH